MVLSVLPHCPFDPGSLVEMVCFGCLHNQTLLIDALLLVSVLQKTSFNRAVFQFFNDKVPVSVTSEARSQIGRTNKSNLIWVLSSYLSIKASSIITLMEIRSSLITFIPLW